MQSSHSKNSDKVNIIDYLTFAQIQQHSNFTSSGAARKVRNSKYRKKHKRTENDFDLLELIAVSNIRKAPKKRAHHKKGASLIQQARVIKKRGKTREIREKKLTRLKKCILRNRELRHSIVCPPNTEPNNCEILHDVASINVCHDDAGNHHSLDYINPIETPTHGKLSAVTHQISEMSLQDSSPKPFKSIHSRRFREYCDNCTTPDLAQLCRELLSDINRFQRRAFQKNPIKANAHRRIVFGFREVQNNLRINKIKLVLIATDCEQCSLAGGIDDTIESIKAECKSLEIPYAFPLQRRQLAYALNKIGTISCVGILDYDGARDKFSQLLLSLETARAKYVTSYVEKTEQHFSGTIN